MLEWLTVADDRTGALEVAGEIARWLGPVMVTVRTPSSDGTAAVVDIASRHATAHEAADRAVAAAATPARHRAHKIDSLLRGNWAHELVALERASHERVLLVPALPRLGRVCQGGIVQADGIPVGGHDARRATRSPRPAEHLVAAGADGVVELAGAGAVADWTRAGGAFAVCDASCDADLEAIAAAWRGSDVRFAGTAGSIAAAAAVVAPGPPADAERVTFAGDVLVVCGSLHPMAREQVDAVRAAAMTGVTVLASPPADGPVAPRDAERVAAELGTAARDVLATRCFGVLVVVGGDTAAAVLGHAPMIVGGTLAPGVPWSRRADGSGPLVVTKAGGFGHAATLVDLLAARSREGR